MKKTISVISDADQTIESKITKPVEVPAVPDTPVSESLLDSEIEEIFQRAAEIDELTTQFICDLMGIDGEMAAAVMDTIDPEILESIENEFERVLAEYGIFIHKPTIVEDEAGNEVVVPSIYEGGCI